MAHAALYRELSNIPMAVKNGSVFIQKSDTVKNRDFKLENDAVEWVVNNIERFTQDILKDKLVSFETEMEINKRVQFCQRGRRIDLYVTGEKTNHIIEFKNPKSGSENREAIGQILDYGREFSEKGESNELVILTTRFDINCAKTIAYYNLPIRYIYISKRLMLEYRGDKNE